MTIAFSHRHFDELTLRELYDLLQLRDEVFVVGQKITAEAEVDGLDPQCVHILGRDEAGRIVATTRLFADAIPVKVGRVAVHSSLQRRGIGTQLMHYVHVVIGKRAAVMSAQAHLQDWYGALGWQRKGEGYLEANIPHVKLVRPAGA